MPKFDETIDIGLRIWNDPRQMNKNLKDMVGKHQQAGRDAGEAMVSEVEKRVPRIRKAFNSVVEANMARARAGRDANKVQAQANALEERALALGKEAIAQKARANALAQAEADLLTREAQLRDKVTEATKTQTEAEDKLAKKKSAHANGSKKELGEIDRQIRALRAEAKLIPDKKARGALYREANVMAHESSPLREKAAKEKEAIDNFARFVASLKQETDDLVAEYKQASSTITQLQNGKKKALADLDATQEAHNKTLEESIKLDEAKKRSGEDLEKLDRRRAEALASLEDAKRAEEEREKKKKGGGNKGSMGVLGSMLTDLPGVPGGRAGAVIGSGALIVMASMAEAVVTASQAMALLPAVGVAAGAAMATLAIGTQGFGDAIKDMGDPEKFAKALAGLSPNAQQAALEIKALVDGPLGDLKRLTQDALFENGAGMLNQASGLFGPGAQRLTTGIAGSMNDMMGNFLGEMSKDSNMASFDKIVDNIVNAFQRLEPAVAPFTDAILGIIETGSSFLPGLATGLSNAANSFANFISQAQADGSFEEFIRKGIDATKVLIGYIGDIGKWIYQTFGNKSPEEFRATLEAAGNIAKGIIEFIQGLAAVMNDVLNIVQPIADAMGGWENLIKAAGAMFLTWKLASLLTSIASMTTHFKGMPALIAKIGGALGAIKVPAWLAALTKLGGTALGAYLIGKDNPAYNQPNDPKSLQAQVDALKEGLPPLSGGGGNFDMIPQNQGRHPGRMPFGTGETNGMPHNQQYPLRDVPGVPDENAPNTDSEKIAAELEKLNPSNFMPQIGAMPQPGPNADPRAVQEAYQKVIEQGRDVRDAHMDLAAMQAAGVSSEYEILQAKEKLADEQWDFNQAQLDLAEETRGKLGKMSDAFGTIGANLDDDLGFSKGLPGLADNLVRFIASLAAAPVMGALAPLAAGAQGTGILGMMGYTGGNSGGNSASYSTYAGAQGGGYAGGSSRVDAMMALAQASSGNVKYAPASDLVNGLADCSGSISDLYEILKTGTTNSGRQFTTTNFASDAEAAKLGFLPGYQEGALNVGVNPYPGQSGHMAATLPNGVNFEGGGGTGGGAQYGGNAAGALDPQFEKQYYLPLGPTGPAPGMVPQPAPRTSTSTPWIPQQGAGGGTPTAPPLIMPTGPSTNTNPGLSPGLPAPGSLPGGGAPGANGLPMPRGFGPGMAPQAPPGAPQPGGLGNTIGGNYSTSYAPTTPSEQAAPSWSPQGGGQLGNGFLGMAMGLASGAAGAGANMFAPGSGAAAQAAADMAQKAIQRTIAFGGQAAGIGMQGLMETFGVSDPDGGGSSGGSSWLTRIAGGLAGAKPATGLGAGKADKESKVDPNAPQNQGQPGQPGGPGQPGSTTTNNYNSTIHLAPDKQTGQAMTNELNAAAYNAHINPGG